jgi:hypothetical protein
VPLEVLQLEAMPKSKFLQEPGKSDTNPMHSGMESEADLKVEGNLLEVGLGGDSAVALSINLSQKGLS